MAAGPHGGAGRLGRSGGEPRPARGDAGACARMAALIVALVMAVLSPVMAEVGKHVAPAGEIEEGGSDE